MAVLINTPKWHVEFGESLLWVTSRVTGLTLAVQGQGLSGQVRACLKTHSPDRVAETFSRIYGPNANWVKLYKRLPELPSADIEVAA